MIHKKFRETNAIYLLTITSITCFHIFQLQIEIGENVNFMELAQKFRETNFCADKLLWINLIKKFELHFSRFSTVVWKI